MYLCSMPYNKNKYRSEGRNDHKSQTGNTLTKNVCHFDLPTVRKEKYRGSNEMAEMFCLWRKTITKYYLKMLC